jgi:O-antigen/teichoic acid export membrane protein
MLVQRLTATARHPRLHAVVGSASGQVLLFGATVVVSRVYTPDQLSSYGVFFALFNMLMIASMLRLEQAVLYASDREEANRLIAAALIALPLVLLVTAYPTYAYLSSNPHTASDALPLLLALVVSLIGGGFARLQTQVLARADAFHYLALVNFIRPAFIALLQFSVALLGPGAIRLQIALAVSQLLLAASTLLISARVTGRWSIVGKPIDRAGVWEALKLKKNVDFVRFSLPQNLLFVASESLVPLSISFLFPNESAVAMFWLASRVVFAPANIFAESIRVQIYRLVARNRGELRFVLRTTALLFGFIIVPIAAIAVAGRPLFQFAFGPEWGDASEYALVLGLLVAVNVSSMPIVAAIPLVGMQRHYAIVEAAGLALRAGLLFAVPWSNAFQSVAATSIAYIALLTIFMAFVVRALAAAKPQ